LQQANAATCQPIGALTNGPSWWQDWTGECVAIVGAGPSAKKAGVETLRDRIHVIAINESFKLCPWAEILYGCDKAWWDHHRGLPDFAGLRLCHDGTACQYYKGLQRIWIDNPAGDELLFDRPTYLGAGGTSAFQAMNLALQFGATGILLVGVDCTLEHGEHWFGRYPSPMNNPAQSNVVRWKKAFDGAAYGLRKRGIDVVNCSPISALVNYPKMTIPEALARWQL